MKIVLFLITVLVVLYMVFYQGEKLGITKSEKGIQLEAMKEAGKAIDHIKKERDEAREAIDKATR